MPFIARKWQKMAIFFMEFLPIFDFFFHRSILNKKWPNMAGLLTFQSSPTGIKMANLSVFDHLGPFWAALQPFGPFQTIVDLFAPKHLRQTLLCPFGEKIHFCLK